MSLISLHLPSFIPVTNSEKGSYRIRPWDIDSNVFIGRLQTENVLHLLFWRSKENTRGHVYPQPRKSISNLCAPSFVSTGRPYIPCRLSCWGTRQRRMMRPLRAVSFVSSSLQLNNGITRTFPFHCIFLYHRSLFYKNSCNLGPHAPSTPFKFSRVKLFTYFSTNLPNPLFNWYLPIIVTPYMTSLGRMAGPLPNILAGFWRDCKRMC